jgi:hypothetical protein
MQWRHEIVAGQIAICYSAEPRMLHRTDDIRLYFLLCQCAHLQSMADTALEPDRFARFWQD